MNKDVFGFIFFVFSIIVLGMPFFMAGVAWHRDRIYEQDCAAICKADYSWIEDGECICAMSKSSCYNRDDGPSG